jgi:hypothetical protein
MTNERYEGINFEIRKLLEQLYFSIAVLYIRNLGISDKELKKLFYAAFSQAEEEIKEWFRVNCPECPELLSYSLDDYVNLDDIIVLAREYVKHLPKWG